jgi:integrase
MPSIYARQKNEEGKWRYIRVNVGPGRRPIDLTGPFFLRVKDNGHSQWLPAGDSIDEAKEAAERHEAVREAVSLAAKSGLVVESGNASRLSAKIATFLAETKANKARKTHLAYANAMRYFTQSCKRTNIEDIKREDMLAFKTHLRDEGLSETSVYNNFLYVMIFLKWCGTRAGIKKNDWPPKPEREPEEYSDEEITKLLAAADTENIKPTSPRRERSHQGEERLLLNSFLCSAMRSGELEHLTYGDIDFKNSVWTVQPKTNWKTKTPGSQRDVPIPEWLTKKIHKRMTDGSHQRSDLIFPSRDGKPDRKLLNVVKRVAVRAGLLKVVGKHANGMPILAGMRVDDHKFRSTAITRWLRDGVAPQDVMAWVGHKKLDTILRYAAKVNVRKAETRKKAEKTFAQFANVGD